MPQVCLHPFTPYLFPFTLTLPSVFPVQQGFCLCTKLCALRQSVLNGVLFFFLALSTFCSSWSKLHSWDSPSLLALKPLLAVMFVKIGKEISVCGSYLNYCFSYSGLTVPWLLIAQQDHFSLPLQCPGLDSITVQGHHLLCPSVFLVSPLFALCNTIMPLVSSCKPAWRDCAGEGGGWWGNNKHDVTVLYQEKITLEELLESLLLVELLHSSAISLDQTRSSGACFLGTWLFFLPFNQDEATLFPFLGVFFEVTSCKF